MDLGTLIREAREDANLTQAQVAEAAGVDRGTYYNWESGRCTPRSLAQLGAVADVVGLRLDGDRAARAGILA